MHMDHVTDCLADSTARLEVPMLLDQVVQYLTSIQS